MTNEEWKMENDKWKMVFRISPFPSAAHRLGNELPNLHATASSQPAVPAVVAGPGGVGTRQLVQLYRRLGPGAFGFGQGGRGHHDHADSQAGALYHRSSLGGSLCRSLVAAHRDDCHRSG